MPNLTANRYSVKIIVLIIKLKENYKVEIMLHVRVDNIYTKNSILLLPLKLVHEILGGPLTHGATTIPAIIFAHCYHPVLFLS